MLVAALAAVMLTNQIEASQLDVGSVLVGRGGGGSGLAIDPETGTYTGMQTRVPSGTSLQASDLTYDPTTGLGYAVRGTNKMYEFDSQMSIHARRRAAWVI